MQPSKKEGGPGDVGASECAEVSHATRMDREMLVIRVDAGSDLHASVLDACRRNHIESGMVVTGIGQVRDIELGYLGEEGYLRERFPGPMELVSLQGSIAPGEGALTLHLHASLSDDGFRVRGGHLFAARVGATAEITVSRIFGLKRESRAGGPPILDLG